MAWTTRSPTGPDLPHAQPVKCTLTRSTVAANRDSHPRTVDLAIPSRRAIHRSAPPPQPQRPPKSAPRVHPPQQHPSIQQGHA